MSDYVSKKQLVSIREFLENYCNLKCNWNGKLTHKRMNEYLSLNGKHLTRGKIGTINREEKLIGKFIYVRDEVGQVIPYKNPNFGLLKLKVALTTISNKSKLEEIRSNYLKKENLMYDEYGMVISIDEYNEKCRLERELKEELEQNKLLDKEQEYYEKIAKNNSKVKVKNYYMVRRR